MFPISQMKKRLFILLSVFICVHLWFPTSVFAEDDPKPEPGLTLTFTSAGATDSRIARLIALHIPDGQAPTPFLKPGPFTATFSGNLNLRIRDTNTFTAHGRGKLKLTINDKLVLETTGDDLSTTKSEPTKLTKGKNKFLVEYTAPAKGDADVQLFWSARDFPAEPISPLLFTTIKPPMASAVLRNGRNLFATLHCIKCHSSPEKLTMPELAGDAPNLTDVGARLNAPWIARWIENPQSIRPSATMPQVTTNPKDAQDIAAYLGTLGSPKTPAVSPDDKSIAAGGRLFTQLGCIACHTPGNAASPDPTRISLSHVGAKFQPGALKEFLLKPEKNYAWIRMPDFHLTDAEATNLAAYLTKTSGTVTSVTVIPGDPAHGKTLFTSSGCLNCHTGPGENSAKAPALAQITNSTWSQPCKAVKYNLASDELAALKTFGATGTASLAQDNPVEISQRMMTTLNCLACHSRDKTSDRLSQLGDEITAIESALPPFQEENTEKYSPDQARPNLTWTGEKLKTEWAEKFIAGNLSYKPRAWLKARMPAFPSRAKFIAEGLAAEHGLPANTAADPAPDSAMIPLGQKLVGEIGGFACIKCHGIAATAAKAAFEAPGINFAQVKDRLRKPYYLRWTRNPQRVEPGTRMPTFVDADAKTSIMDPYNGDGTKQFEAIWQFLLQGDKVAAP